MDPLEELKSYLKVLNYPGISIMPNDEIADIFSKKNRIGFLTWFVEKWDSDIVLPSDEEMKRNTLANILCEGGFCTSQESIKFVHNALELEPNEQLRIINRMLYNLRILSLVDEQEESACDINYVEQMEILSKFDINIFPTMGPVQVRKLEERQRKFEQFEREIKELKQEIESMNVKYNLNTDISREDKTNWNSLNLVKDQISTLMTNFLNISNMGEKLPNGEFDDSLEASVSDCLVNISEVVKLCRNRKVISQFSVIDIDKKDNDESCDLADTIKHLSLLSEKVLNME